LDAEPTRRKWSLAFALRSLAAGHLQGAVALGELRPVVFDGSPRRT